MQAYSLASAVLMAHKRRVECEDAKRDGQWEAALLAVESCYYWQYRQAQNLVIMQTAYKTI